MTEPNIERTETCKFLSYRDDKQTNVTEVELELIAKLVPYLWNEDEDKISFAVICEDKPGLLLEIHYPRRGSGFTRGITASQAGR